MTDIVLIHGWGMGPEIWDVAARSLSGRRVQRADLGFRGTPAKPEAVRPLVVAHSLGLMWALTHLPQPWSGLVAVNGFTRFSRDGDFPGVDHRLLSRMSARLTSEPAAVVGDFLRRCGQDSPRTDTLDTETLARGLDWLDQWDRRAEFARLECPVLAVAGGADPIVTPDHSRACFAAVPLTVIDGAGHLLPLSHGEWLGRRLAAVIKGDWSA